MEEKDAPDVSESEQERLKIELDRQQQQAASAPSLVMTGDPSHSPHPSLHTCMHHAFIVKSDKASEKTKSLAGVEDTKERTRADGPFAQILTSRHIAPDPQVQDHCLPLLSPCPVRSFLPHSLRVMGSRIRSLPCSSELQPRRPVARQSRSGQ